MNNIQQLVFEKMKTLSIPHQESVLYFIEELLAPNSIKSDEQIEELLIEGIDSLDRGEGIEATDEWWEQERDRLINNASNLLTKSN